MRAAGKRGTSGSVGSGTARPAAYLKDCASLGVKVKNGASGDRSGVTINWTFEDGLRNPVKPAATPPLPLNTAFSFVDSVMYLLNKSLASCVEISDPVPDEGMFLLLVPICGVIEAKYWADTFGLPSARSFGLIEPFLYGRRKHFAEAPDVIG